MDEVVTGDQEEGTYYVDQAGHYYYQTGSADGGQVMTVVSGMCPLYKLGNLEKHNHLTFLLLHI